MKTHIDCSKNSIRKSLANYRTKIQKKYDVDDKQANQMIAAALDHMPLQDCLDYIAHGEVDDETDEEPAKQSIKKKQPKPKEEKDPGICPACTTFKTCPMPPQGVTIINCPDFKRSKK